MPNDADAPDRFDAVPRKRGRIGAHRAENPGGRGLIVFLWVVIAVVVVVAAGIVGFLTLFQDNPLLAGIAAAGGFGQAVDAAALSLVRA